MNFMRKSMLFGTAVFALVATQSGCSSGDEKGAVASPEIVQAIQARKESYKEIGGAFKSISDEIKSGAPDVNSVGPLARDILSRAQSQLPYFIPGSDTRSGEKTRAKPAIWADMAGFTKAHEDFIGASERLVSAVVSADMAAIAEAHKKLGATCKSCHDRFRAPDD
jgi:cytochrome c556